jgi:hypothetical protein
MPFPLAHPAAVLPLRRFCPRLLSFPALVLGTICPDLGYAFGETGVSDFSHTAIGGTAFGLLAGCILLGLVYASNNWILRMAPAPYKDELRKGFQVTLRSIPTILLSLAVGTWTHLLLDCFTHSHGWATEHLDVLQAAVFTLHDRPVRLCHLIWYFCSFAGLTWLVTALRQWQGGHGPAGMGFRKSYLIEGIIVALLVLPIEVLHHYVHSGFGLLLVGALSALLSLVVLARPIKTETPVQPQRSR